MNKIGACLVLEDKLKHVLSLLAADELKRPAAAAVARQRHEFAASTLTRTGILKRRLAALKRTKSAGVNIEIFPSFYGAKIYS